MDTLRRITEERRADAVAAARSLPIDVLRRQAQRRRHHSLAERLRAGGTPVMAEAKRASPSAGLLSPDYRPAETARAYARAGAAAVSVLTEPRHFLGSSADLRAVRRAVDLPVLRKDFLSERYQVAEAAAWGADVVLLIVAALAQERMRELYSEAVALGLDVLVESHTEAELRRALELDTAVIGVNSRDLKTLKTDLAVARAMARHIPDGRLAVAESGIRDRADIETLSALGYNGFLVGEALMRARDPEEKLRELAGGPPAFAS